VTVRQTNIIWVAFILGLNLLDLASSKKASDDEEKGVVEGDPLLGDVRDISKLRLYAM
jgi:hypothetical protein